MVWNCETSVSRRFLISSISSVLTSSSPALKAEPSSLLKPSIRPANKSSKWIVGTVCSAVSGFADDATSLAVSS
eukprot:3135776-Pyramimonas_sp.AAC.1